MHKTMNGFFFFLIFLVSNDGFSLTGSIHSLATTDYELAPGKALTLVNTLSKTLSVACQMKVITRQNHSILIKALNGGGQINGTTLNKGQTLVQTVQNMQVIPVIANPGAKAEFTNLGPNTVTASCG